MLSGVSTRDGNKACSCLFNFGPNVVLNVFDRLQVLVSAAGCVLLALLLAVRALS